MMFKHYMALLLGIISIAATVIIYCNTNTLYHNQYDDSYISMRYSINLAEHGQLVYNLNERVDSASSFLYTVILALFYRIGIHNLETVSFLLNMLSLGMIAAFVYLCALRLSGNMIGSILLALVASLHGFISGWSATGMDTVPYCALLCILVWTIFECNDKKSVSRFKLYLSLSLAIALVFMRLESIVFMPIWWIAMGCNKRWGKIILVIIALFYSLKSLYFGTIIPHSLQFKQLVNYYSPNPMQIIHTWAQYALIVPIMGIIGMFMDTRVRWLGLYIIIALIACLWGPRADWIRYSVVLLPLMLVCGAPLFRKI